MICSGVLRFPWLIRSSKIEVHAKPNSLVNGGPLFQGQASQFLNEPLGILPTDLLYGSVISSEMAGVYFHTGNVHPSEGRQAGYHRLWWPKKGHGGYSQVRRRQNCYFLSSPI